MTSLSGVGAIFADGGVGRLRSAAPVLTLGEDVAVESRSGTLRLLPVSGVSDVSFDISGPMTADSGRIEIQTPTTSHGQTTVRNGGVLQVDAPLVNFGNINVAAGGQLTLANSLHNEGAIVIEDSALMLHWVDYSSPETGAISGPGSVEIRDSMVVAATSMSLAKLTTYSGPGVDYGVRNGSLNLEGATVAIGSTPGTRWFLHSNGTLRNGVVNSLDSSELIPAVPPVGEGDGRATLNDIELNADARIPVGTELSVTGTLTGSGRLIVDGGRLKVGNVNSDDNTALAQAILPRIEPLGGEVTLHGKIDNRDQTLRLPAGVRWGYSHVRADGIVGGRLEGEPGTVLYVDDGYGGYSFGFATFNEGVTLALPVTINNTRAYVRDGLTLDETSLTIGDELGTSSYEAGLIFLGDQTLAGVGEIRFGSSATPYTTPSLEIRTDVGAATGLTLGEQIVVRTSEGNGSIIGNPIRGGNEPAMLSNYGMLLAENGHRLELFTGDFGQFGTLRSEADAELFVDDPNVTNNGRLEIIGGTMEFTGSLTQATGSVLAIELSAELLAPGNATLDIAGDTVLGGRLEVSLVEGFSLVAGEGFALLSAGSVSGQFDAALAPLLEDGLQWWIVYGSNIVELQVRSPGSHGDFNDDGVIDGGDFLEWQRNPALGELSDWLGNYGITATRLAAPISRPVPEPPALSILILLMAVFVGRSQYLRG